MIKESTDHIRSSHKPHISARMRVSVCVLAGIVAGVAAGLFGYWKLAPLIGWDVAAVAVMVWIGLTVFPMNEQETERFASAEDPGRTTADGLLLLASLASLIAVAFALVQAGNLKGTIKDVMAGLAVLSVAVSWTLVHIVFMLRYARIYFDKPGGGIDFNGDEEGDGPKPTYTDFAYVAFTIGMTFQVSDTSLKTRALRGSALHHALISYVFGAGILAMTINLVAGLNK